MIQQSQLIEGARVRLAANVNIIKHGHDQFAPSAGDFGTLTMIGLIDGEDVWAVAFDGDTDIKFVAGQLTSGEIVQLVDVCEVIPPTYPTHIDHVPDVIHPVGDEIERLDDADWEKFLAPDETPEDAAAAPIFAFFQPSYEELVLGVMVDHDEDDDDYLEEEIFDDDEDDWDELLAPDETPEDDARLYFEDDEDYPEGLSEDGKELFDIDCTLHAIEVEQKDLRGESFAMYQDRIAWLEKRADELKARREVLNSQILASGAPSESELE